MRKSGKIRVPKQKRSKALTEHIMETAAALFSERGYYSVTSHDIADAAEISIGSFYSYYSDKKQLLLAVLNKYIDNVNQTFPNIEDYFTLNEVPTSKELKRWITQILYAHRIESGFEKQIEILKLDDSDVAEIMQKQESLQIDYIEHWLRCCLNGDCPVANIRAAAYVINNATEKNIHDLAYSKLALDENGILDALSEMIYQYMHGLINNYSESKTQK